MDAGDGQGQADDAPADWAELKASLRDAGRRAMARTREVAETSRQAVDERVQTLTLAEFRTETLEALDDIVAVLVMLDARLRRLEERAGETSP